MNKADMEELASALNLGEFDLLLVGDGSGTTHAKACGWCCHYYDRRTGEVVTHSGGTSGGTNNFAELMPYVQALWYDQACKQMGQRRVAVVSDSEITVRCGNKVYVRRANACLWRAIEWFEENGYTFAWTHVRRNTNPVSTRSDKIAGASRKLFE